MAGAEDMYDDFDINEDEMMSGPADLSDPWTDEVEAYRYYLQRAMCSVPRAEALRGRTSEGTSHLRVTTYVLFGAMGNGRDGGQGGIPRCLGAFDVSQQGRGSGGGDGRVLISLNAIVVSYSGNGTSLLCSGWTQPAGCVGTRRGMPTILCFRARIPIPIKCMSTWRTQFVLIIGCRDKLGLWGQTTEHRARRGGKVPSALRRCMGDDKIGESWVHFCTASFFVPVAEPERKTGLCASHATLPCIPFVYV